MGEAHIDLGRVTEEEFKLLEAEEGQSNVVLRMISELRAFRGGKLSQDTRFEPLPAHGDHMTWEEFMEGVQNNLFTDDDGYGELASYAQCSDITINPSDTYDGYKKPDWATHVVWYNK